jgi:hypothetical protein
VQVSSSSIREIVEHNGDQQYLEIVDVLRSPDYAEYASSRPSAVMRILDELLITGDSELDLFVLFEWIKNSAHYAICPLKVFLNLIADWENDCEFLFVWAFEHAQMQC